MAVKKYKSSFDTFVVSQNGFDIVFEVRTTVIPKNE